MTERDWSELDARLVAYLDGVSSDDERRELETELAENDELRKRLGAMDIDIAALRSGMDAVLENTPPVPSASTTGRSAMWYAAAASVMLALFLGGWVLGRPSVEEDWRDFAAAYHLLYRTETLASAPVGDGGVAVVSSAIGHDLSSLSSVPGLEFRRAQVLGWEDRPLVQFAYLDQEGRPFAICIIETAEDREGVETVERHGLPTASFTRDSLQVMVIGGAGVREVGALATEVSRLF